MKNIKMTIKYDGTRFKGWQRLSNEEMTIQGKIEGVLSKMFDREVTIDGASRTDAGVHAIGQIACFKVEDHEMEHRTLKGVHSELNRFLPEDIVVVEMEYADPRFHPRLNAKSKVYRYMVYEGKYRDPFKRRYSTRRSNLDLELMKRASLDLIGEHDFTTYSNIRSKKKSMTRRIYRIDFIRDAQQEMMTIEIEGNSFLHNMVRRIVGTILDIGRKRFEVTYAKEILNKRERSLVGETASETGLFLYKVNY
jgi:tRNA pseudouridine38-40 synthase